MPIILSIFQKTDVGLLIFPSWFLIFSLIHFCTNFYYFNFAFLGLCCSSFSAFLRQKPRLVMLDRSPLPVIACKLSLLPELSAWKTRIFALGAAPQGLWDKSQQVTDPLCSLNLSSKWRISSKLLLTISSRKIILYNLPFSFKFFCFGGDEWVGFNICPLISVHCGHFGKIPPLCYTHTHTQKVRRIK